MRLTAPWITTAGGAPEIFDAAVSVFSGSTIRDAKRMGVFIHATGQSRTTPPAGMPTENNIVLYKFRLSKGVIESATN